MGFFKKTSNVVKKKGKFEKRKATNNFKNPKKARKEDEEISSDEEDELINKTVTANSDYESDEDLDESDDKAVREAKLLLEAIKHVEEEEESDAEEPKQTVKPTKVYEAIAQHVRFGNIENLISHRLHRFSPVCVCFSNDGQYLVSCSKDGSTVKFNVKERKKCGFLKMSKKNDNIYHKGKVTCCAISPDDKYLVTGGEDTYIKVWDFKTLEHVKDFQAHRSTVTSLAFRKTTDSLELFSASTDRSIKAWNLDQLGFVDTMYGHQDTVMQIEVLSRARVIACGGLDKTVRNFKVTEESQLVFNGYAESISIDTITMLNEEHFVSGAMDGSLYVWSNTRKKPVCVVKQAHGYQTTKNNDKPFWICSVAAYPYTDLVASGSWDGFLRLWKIGFINHIRFSEDGQSLVCAVGQEHKNGRWWKLKEAKNSVVIIPLIRK